MFFVIFNEPIGQGCLADAGLMLSQRRRHRSSIGSSSLRSLGCAWLSYCRPSSVSTNSPTKLFFFPGETHSACKLS